MFSVRAGTQVRLIPACSRGARSQSDGSKEAAQGGGDALDFGVFELGKQGQRQDLARGALGLGQRRPRTGESGLLVGGARVIDLGADALPFEMGAQFVAARGANRVLVEDVIG